MHIRFAEQGDLEQIAALYRKNHLETYRGLLPQEYFSRLTPAFAEEKWRGWLEDPGRKLWIAVRDGAFLGFAAGREDPALPGTWYLDSLHVGRDARGQGVGTALIRAAGAYACGRGLSRMSVCIVKGNDAARKLYRGLGAEHLEDFEDDFCGTVSHSEKLVWNSTDIFR